eukprot:scaffold43156_cov62-Phaeocystis_antarctica.AAC.3
MQILVGHLVDQMAASAAVAARAAWRQSRTAAPKLPCGAWPPPPRAPAPAPQPGLAASRSARKRRAPRPSPRLRGLAAGRRQEAAAESCQNATRQPGRNQKQGASPRPARRAARFAGRPARPAGCLAGWPERAAARPGRAAVRSARLGCSAPASGLERNAGCPASASAPQAAPGERSPAQARLRAGRKPRYRGASPNSSRACWLRAEPRTAQSAVLAAAAPEPATGLGTVRLDAPPKPPLRGPRGPAAVAGSRGATMLRPKGWSRAALAVAAASCVPPAPARQEGLASRRDSGPQRRGVPPAAARPSG